ncbi:hypothetical protein Y032_0636g932 [Ancylostoma ceylanicum]|uniref:Uncharacterized protein n=1 Tax=Ancylostoma ceylanicum TaxID=53326 RepID=A0A016WJT6_9BILA|nr:hypothetical protein Y032_0636g932 [Ancylostoma ceylanicum]
MLPRQRGVRMDQGLPGFQSGAVRPFSFYCPTIFPFASAEKSGHLGNLVGAKVFAPNFTLFPKDRVNIVYGWSLISQYFQLSRRRTFHHILMETKFNSRPRNSGSVGATLSDLPNN